MMKNIQSISAASVLAASFLILSAGCMTVSDKQTVVPSANTSQTFGNKRIAVLPVKTQTSLAPDSAMSLRNEINKRLGLSLRSKLPSAKITEIAGVADQLNQKGALPAFEQLIATYENTGVIDKQKTAALGRALETDYLMLSRLKSEKLDIIISRGMGASLELMLIHARTGEVSWAGTGEWKRGGIFGAGKAPADEAAENLVALALGSL